MSNWLLNAQDLIEDWKRQLRDWLPPRTIQDAACRGDIQRVRRFLAKKINASAPDKHGCTALGYAAAQGHLETVRLLLNEGAHVDGITGDHGGLAVFTPLMGAITCNKMEVARLLIDHGANVRLSDNFGETALSLAVGWSSAEVVGWLLAVGTEVNVANNQGITPLMKAALWGRQEQITLLLENGASVNAQDATGRTALMLAVQDANAPLVNRLLEVGADTSISDSIGRTALEYARPQVPSGYPVAFFAPVIALLEQARSR